MLPKDDVFFCFDLELPWDFEPVAVDGEVRLSASAPAPAPAPPTRAHHPAAPLTRAPCLMRQVQGFERMRVAEVLRHVAFGASPSFPCLADRGAEETEDAPEQAERLNAFKPNINLVVLDFLLRHGHIQPSAPRYLELVAALRQGECR